MIDTIMADRGAGLTYTDITETSYSRTRTVRIGELTVQYVKKMENGVVKEEYVSIKDCEYEPNTIRMTPKCADTVASALLQVQHEDAEYGDKRSEW